MSEASLTAFAEITSEVVAAYVAKNSVPAGDLPALIVSVHEAFKKLGQPDPVEAPSEPLKPAVPIKKSVTDDYIISLEDGRKLKSMKRYLAGLGMTPAEYRTKWGLPADYPTVAPSYAAKRSELARSLGLGRKPGQGASEAAPEVDEPEAAQEAAAQADDAKRPRKRAAKAA